MKGTFVLVCLLMLAGCKDPQLARCEALFEPLKHEPTFAKEMDAILRKEGSSLDQRIEQRCRYWISNGQRF